MSNRLDDRELNELLENAVKMSRSCDTEGSTGPGRAVRFDSAEPRIVMSGRYVQWSSSDDTRFVPCGKTSAILRPGVYEINSSPDIGLYFEKVPVKTEGLIRFPQTNISRVVSEIQLFWDKEDLFKEFGLPHKRGILLWGVPGGGKSTTCQLIMHDVVNRQGVVIKFGHPELFMAGMRVFREIQPDTPAVVLMEDLDSILGNYGETEVLNILDGVERIQKTVFLSTTNYPEQLGARIVNRPSRFDKRFKIDFPNAESRRMYFDHLFGDRDPAKYGVDLETWVKDTDRFSIAHLKELFVAVVILGDDYDESIETLRSMKESISSIDDEEKMMGFAGRRR